jgi:hypothetical protein
MVNAEGCGGPCEEDTSEHGVLYPFFTGALYVFQNVASGASGPLVDDQPWSATQPSGYVKLTAADAGPPYQPRMRFGRGSAVVS